MPESYLEINKEFWNSRVDGHVDSDFYDNKTFLEGRNSLNKIELPLLGDLKGKSVLHLQCHFGQDSISMARMGARVTAVDFSEKAIATGKRLNEECGTKVEFVCADVYSLPEILQQEFDIVFTSYGTIGWLPVITKWANVVSKFTKSGGAFVMAEFHPFVWTFDEDLNEPTYSYFNDKPIVDDEEGSYANPANGVKSKYMGWNHGLAEVINALKSANIQLEDFQEFDYSPYDVFPEMELRAEGEYILKKWPNLIPLVYSLRCTKG